MVPEKNEFITRRLNTTQKAIQSIDKAISMNTFKSIKMNVVIMKNFNCDEIIDFVEFVKERPIEVRFIEFMPFDKN